MAFYEDFLVRNRDTITAHFGQLVASVPRNVSAEAVLQRTEIIDYLSNVMLTKIKPSDPEAQMMTRYAISAGVTKEQVAQYLNIYLDAVRATAAGDTALDEQQRVRVGRMIEQSGRYLMLVILPTYKPNEG